MEAEHHGFRVLRPETVAHEVGIEAARSSKFGDLLEEIAVRIKEEREPRSEIINVQASRLRSLDVRNGVGKGKRHLLHSCRSSFADVIPADRDGIPVRQLAACPGEQIRHDAHRSARRIYIRATCRVLLQYIVLHRARYFFQVCALFFCKGYV